MGAGAGITIKELWTVHGRKIRYLAAGGWNTIFGYGSFVGLYHIAVALNLHYLVALTASQVLATTNAFMMYKHFVFKTQGDYLREYFRFSAVYWVLFLFNLVLLPILVNTAHIGPVLAQGIILPVTVVASYLVHSRFSFKRAG